MKKYLLKSFALLAMLFSVMTMSAVSYCGETITATDGTTTAVITCTQPEAGKYVMIVTSPADNFTGLIGDNNYFELDGVGGTQVKNNNSSEKHTCSFDETTRTLTITLNCTNAPKMYTPLYLNIGGEKIFNTIQHQVFEWPTSCEGGETTDPTPEPEEPGVIDKWAGVDWVTGSDNKYKISHDCLASVVSVQKPDFAEQIGIYVTTNGTIESCTVNGAIQGGGMVLYLSSFTAKETEVTINYTGGSCTFWVYYADGSEGGETPGEGGGETGVPVLESVELFGSAQNFVLLTPTASDDKGVTSYLIAKSGGAETEVTPDATTGQIKIASLTLGTTYTYTVKAKDADGNVSNAKEITFSTLDNVFCEEEVLPNPNLSAFANQKLTYTAKKVSDTETYFAITSSTSTLTAINTVSITRLGEGTLLEDKSTLKNDWDLTDNTLSRIVKWETYPTSPITIAISAKRAEGGLIGVPYSVDVSNTCGPTPESIIESTYFAPNWAQETNSSATYDAATGTITVDLESKFNDRWQAQVKVKHDVDFSADKYYQFSAKFHATEEIKNVMIKVDDNAAIVEDGAVTLPANEDFVYTSSAAKGIAGNNKIIVFDFGYASPCQITIGDILLQEVEKPADNDKPVLHSATLVEGSVTHNSAVLAVSATDNVELAGFHVVDVPNNYDKTFAPIDGKITLTDLTPSTAYNFVVTALDASDNESENSISVSCSTIALLYCDFPTGHQNNANFSDPNGRCLLSVTKLNDTKVRVTLKPNYDNGSTKKIDYLYVISSGGTPYPAEAGADVTEGGYDELSVDITYSNTPANYSFTILWSNVADGGRWQIGLENIAPATLCSAPSDEEAPVMVSAALVSVTHNSALVSVSATDNDAIANYHVVDATNGYDATIAPVGNQINLTGLTPYTSYNFTITALDLAGNESTNSNIVIVETMTLLYCDFPTGNNGDANFGNPDGRILVSLIKITPQNVRVVVKSADAATKNLDLIYIEAAGANPHATTVGADVASSDLRVMSADISYPTIPAKYSFMIQWSNPDWNGRWQINLNDVLESNLCPLPTDDEAPVMVSASLGSVTHNSAVLSVSATDNDEVANYHVVDATNNYDETIAPVGDQITLTDLTPSTTYNFTVTAVDLAGNESANNKTIVVTTDALVYCDFPTGHEGNANFGDANGRCLLTLTKLGNTQIRITVKPNYDNGATQKLDFLYVVANGANPNPATVGDPKLSEGGVDALSVDINYQTLTYPIGSIEIKWSTIGMDGEWATTVTNILESNLCLPIIVDENTDPATLPNGATCDVQFAREMTVVNDIWNTIALPFGMNAEQIARTFGEGTLVAKLQRSSSVASLEEMKLRFDYVDEIEAGTPYIILPMESGKDVVISGVTINTTTNPIVANQVTMYPVLETISYNYDNGDPIKFFLAADGYLHYNEASNQIKGLRAYFTFDNVTTIAQASKVRARIVFDENTETSVDNITMDEVPVKVIQHGQLIIIRNGVKYNVQGQKL